MIVLSVPHTGTRFACTYLDKLKVIYRQIHSEPHCVGDIRYETGKAIIPVKDPILAFCSTFIRSNPLDFEKVLDRLVINYGLLMQMEDWFDFKYFRLDAKDQDAELEKIANFCGKEKLSYKWEPIGNVNDTATDYKVWGIIKKDWGDSKIDMVYRRLQTACEHYGY